MRASIPLLALIAAVSPLLTGQQSPAAVREPRTNVAFPVHVAPPGGGVPHELVGTAVRTRTIFRIAVYAYGLYVDADGARRMLARHAGVPASALERDDGFYQQLLDLDFPMTLRIVLVRNVSGREVAESFDEALAPRVARAARDRGLVGGEAALAHFRTYFTSAEVGRGTEILFSCGPDGRFHTMVAGDVRPALDSPALCWAFFDVYLGDRPISAGGRRSVIARFPALLDR